MKIARRKVDEYVIKDQSFTHPLKLGDFVVIKPHGLLVGHQRENQGPYEVTKIKNFGSYGLKHVFTGQRTARARRDLIKIAFDEQDVRILREKDGLFLNGNLVKNSKVENKACLEYARNPLDTSNLTIPAQEKEKRYQLRNRK